MPLKSFAKCPPCDLCKGIIIMPDAFFFFFSSSVDTVKGSDTSLCPPTADGSKSQCADLESQTDIPEKKVNIQLLAIPNLISNTVVPTKH